MSFRREKTGVSRYPETKSVIVEVNYSGDVEGPADIALLLGDAWHQYCQEHGIDPVASMDKIHRHKMPGVQ